MKCLSLNVDNYDSFDVPSRLLTLSKMSRSERKDLELRLKSELEQLRKLQKRVACLGSNTTALSSYSDIRSCNERQKRPTLESQHRTPKASVPHGKKRPPPGRTGGKTKRSVSQVTPSNAEMTKTKHCESLLNRLMSHQFGWVFNKPVDVVKLNIPDYFTVIKRPMDLSTVKRRLNAGEYSSLVDFAADVRLTFSNAMTYNPPGNDVHMMAETLSKYFERRWKPIEQKISAIDSIPSEPSSPTSCVETKIAGQILPAKKKITPNDINLKPETVKRIMTNEEKHKLSMELEALLAELPETIIDFLKEQSYNAGQNNDDEIEIDIDALSDDTLFKLRKLLDDYMLRKQKIQAKAGLCEIELTNESGFSNLSSLPCTGNDPVEEDIDIVGGNDPPLSSYPPVEIENDGTNKNSKCSSSSSSSSESGSSSTDSDSGSSSGSESDTAKALEPLNPTKEKVGSGMSVDQKKGNVDNSHSVTGDSGNAVGEVEQTSQTNLIANEPESHQEGEDAPPGKQVSPKKFYRAALLRSRFADTILRAREKALEKGEKRNPEKLRMEREELERRLKEEKARLQAEANAAEEARRKAEAEAAAEARRKRELERETARQALQKMEKTVDINESGQFLEDLEMLSAVHDEHLPSLKEEASPDHSQNRLGSFKLQCCSNPLEQLGLYMKVDDEDLEEEPPQSAAAGLAN